MGGVLDGDAVRAALIAVALCGAATHAHADDAIMRGAVVRIEQQEIYVSLGAQQGVAEGAQLRIKRTIKLKHPVTRAAIEEWIPIGAATVTQAGTGLSRAVVGQLVDDIEIGDVVEILVERSTPAVAPTPTPSGSLVPPVPPPDPSTVEVLGVFAAQTGQSLDARIASWERYLSMRADSPYAAAIRTDVEVMRGLRDQLRSSAAPTGTDVVTSARHHARSRAPAGEDLPVVFVLDDPATVASAFLHYRTVGARTYRRVLLGREHDIYLRGAIPADAVTQPGVEYFVEVSTPQGRSGLAIGTPDKPLSVEIAVPTVIDQFGARRGLSSVRLTADYMDFATFDKRDGNHRDRMVTANIDFAYALPGAVKAIGVGYGVYAGEGGSADATWDVANPIPKTGFHYGYADVELGTETAGLPVSFAARLIAGVGKEGFGMGAEARLRIGEREGTNLAFAASTIDQVGTISNLRLGARPAHDLLVGLSVGATNQPNQDDIGVKLGTELEWIGLRSVSIIVRGSWQGRDTHHDGIGAGAGLGVYW